MDDIFKCNKKVQEPTHPGIAPLADPLFAYGGKRVEKFFCFLFTPY